MTPRTPWTEAETKRALYLYFQLPFGQQVTRPCVKATVQEGIADRAGKLASHQYLQLVSPPHQTGESAPAAGYDPERRNRLDIR